jgi:hypothetical protein
MGFLNLYERAWRSQALSIAEMVSFAEPTMLVIDYDAKRPVSKDPVSTVSVSTGSVSTGSVSTGPVSKGPVSTGPILQPQALFDDTFIAATADSIAEFLEKHSASFSASCSASVPEKRARHKNDGCGDCVVLKKPPSIRDGNYRHGFHLHFPKTFLYANEKARLFEAFPHLDPIARNPWLLYGSRKSTALDSYTADHVRVRRLDTAARCERVDIFPTAEYFSSQYLVTDLQEPLVYTPDSIERHLCKFLSIRNLGHEFCREHYTRKLKFPSRPTDLAGTDPAGTDLAGTDLAGTDPAGTDLAGTDPAGTDLAGTDPAGPRPVPTCAVHASDGFESILASYDVREPGSLLPNWTTDGDGDGEGDGEGGEDGEGDGEGGEDGDGDGDGGEAKPVRFVTAATVRDLQSEFPWILFADKPTATARAWKKAGVLFASRRLRWKCVLEEPGPRCHSHDRRPAFFFVARSGRVFIGCGCGRSVKGSIPGQRFRSVPTSVTIRIPPKKSLSETSSQKRSNSPSISVQEEQGHKQEQEHKQGHKQGRKQEQEQAHKQEHKQNQEQENKQESFSLLVKRFSDPLRGVTFDQNAETTWMQTGRASAIATVCPVDGDCRKKADEDAQLFTRLDFWIFQTRVFMRCLSGCEDASTKKAVIPVLSLPNKKKR